MKAVVIRVALLVALAVAVLLGLPGAAAAGSVPSPDSAAAIPGPMVPDDGGTSSTPLSTAACPKDASGTAADSNYLPINRWGDVSDSFHDQLDADLWNDIFEKIQRRMMFSTMLSVGNSMWQITANLTSFSTRFCLLDTVGGDVDSVSARFGKAVLNGGVVTAIVVIAVLVVLWRTKKRSGEWKTLLRPVLVLVFLTVMTAGASNSTKTEPGAWSPWWLAVKVDKAISNLAALPVSALSFGYSGDGLRSDTDQGATSCNTFLNNLQLEYELAFGGGADQLVAAVPMQISQMWEQTGMATWIKAQYGSNNAYGQKVFCRTLESRVRTPVGTTDDRPQQNTQLGLTEAGGIPGANGGSLAWNFSNDAYLEDAAIVGWAACVYDTKTKAWSVDQQWAAMHSGGSSGGGGTVKDDQGKQITPESCQRWWSSTDGVRDRDTYAEMGMVYVDDPGYISAEADSAGAPRVADFMLNWHGNVTATAFALSLTYDIAAAVVMFIFGGISIGIILGKLALLMMIALIVIVLIMSLWPSRESSRLAGYVRTYLGISIMVVSISALFSLITLITSYLAKASTTIGADSLLGVLWFGFSPVLAIVVLHILFSKILKLPSPFKISGALAWGAAAGGMGKSAADGIDNVAKRAAAPLRAGLEIRRWRRTSGLNPVTDENTGAGQKMRAEPVQEQKDNGGDPIGVPSVSPAAADQHSQVKADPPLSGTQGAGARDTQGAGARDAQGASGVGGGADQRMTAELPALSNRGTVSSDGGAVEDRDLVRSGTHLPEGRLDEKVSAADQRHTDLAAAAANGTRRDRARATAAGAAMAAAKSGRSVVRRGRAIAGDTTADAKLRASQTTQRVAGHARRALTWVKENKTKTALLAAGGVVAASAAPIGAIVSGAAGLVGALGGVAAGTVGTVAGASHVATTALASLAVNRLQRREENRHPERVAERSAQREERYAQLAAVAARHQSPEKGARQAPEVGARQSPEVGASESRGEGAGAPPPPMVTGPAAGVTSVRGAAADDGETAGGATQKMGADSFTWAEPPLLNGLTAHRSTDPSEMFPGGRTAADEPDTAPPPPPPPLPATDFPDRTETAGKASPDLVPPPPPPPLPSPPAGPAGLPPAAPTAPPSSPARPTGLPPAPAAPPRLPSSPAGPTGLPPTVADRSEGAAGQGGPDLVPPATAPRPPSPGSGEQLRPDRP